MKKVGLALMFVVSIAASAFAQSERGYIGGAGGFAVTPENTSGAVMLEGGVRVAPHLFVFGDLGQYHDVQPSVVQPSIDLTTEQLSTTGLNTIGTGRVPATFALGGLRYEMPLVHGFMPYALGGLGMAHLSPTATFTYSSGTLFDGSTPTVGQDITSEVESNGSFTLPPSSTALMYSFGGGVQIPVFGSWMADVGYRFSRIEADAPVNAQGMTFGLGYRF
jgi:opacity protein-like surface antigen